MFHIERRVHIEQPQVLVHVPVPVFGAQHIPMINVSPPGFESTISSLFASNDVDPFPGHRSTTHQPRNHSQSQSQSQSQSGGYCTHCGASRGSDQGPYCSKCGKSNTSPRSERTERRLTAADLNAMMGLSDAGYRNGMGAVARVHYPSGW
jgi:uncharacterized paraquat-inducible protein A